MSYRDIVAVASYQPFRDKCHLSFVKSVIAQMNGTPTAPQIVYGKSVLNGTASINAMVFAVLSNATIAAAVSAAPNNIQGGSEAVADGDIDFQVAASLPAFAAAGV